MDLQIKAKQFVFTKNNFKQQLSIVNDDASGEQVGDIENHGFRIP